MDDEAVYQSADVTITRTMARFGDTSYPIGGIGSIRIEQKANETMAGWGVLLVLIGIALLAWSGSLAAAAFTLVLGIVLIVAAFKQPHTLMLRTASGDFQAYEARDVEQLNKIKSALERAVQLRG